MTGVQTCALPILTVYTINKVVITDDKGNILYSGIGLDSKFVNYVPEQELMGNKKITLSSDDRFQIIEQKLYVYCAYKLSPEDFGYEKWNINLLNIFNIPIKVTDCNKNNISESIYTNGYFKMEYKLMDESEFNVIDNKIDFNSESYTELIIKDDCNISDEYEIYRLTIVINRTENNSLLESVREITLSELKTFQIYKYEDYKNAWNSDFGYLDINICNDKTWPFNINTYSSDEIGRASCRERVYVLV